MPRASKKNMKKKKNDNSYSSENEIIIGVTTKPKNVRVENKKTTRTNNNKKNNMSKPKKRTSKSKGVPKKNSKIQNDKDQKIKKINRKKGIAGFIVLFLLLVSWTIYMLTTPMFNITNIEISGNEKNSVETYISLTKVELNTTNIFAITKNSITKNLKENSYVEKVTIKRKLPSTLQINIEERKVAYQVKYNNQYIYLDKQGYILEIADEKENIVKIEGLTNLENSIDKSNRLGDEDLTKLNTIIKIMNYCQYNSIDNQITSINCKDTSNYILTLEKEKKIVYLGDATNLSERILWLKTLLEKEKGNKGEIFINGDLSNRKVYFKPDNKKE